jgi:hypothetical protein
MASDYRAVVRQYWHRASWWFFLTSADTACNRVEAQMMFHVPVKRLMFNDKFNRLETVPVLDSHKTVRIGPALGCLGQIGGA